MNHSKLLGYGYFVLLVAFALVTVVYESPEWATVLGFEWGVPIFYFFLWFLITSKTKEVMESYASYRSSD